MRVQASAVRTGDVVRGIGLIVEAVEPQVAEYTHLVGHVNTPDSEYPVSVNLPNNHIVRVRRLFREGDVVTVPSTEVDESYEEGYVRVEVLFVYPDEGTLTVREEGDTTDTSVFSVPFHSARHAA